LLKNASTIFSLKEYIFSLDILDWNLIPFGKLPSLIDCRALSSLCYKITISASNKKPNNSFTTISIITLLY
jgi:hypothetical protein